MADREVARNRSVEGGQWQSGRDQSESRIGQAVWIAGTVSGRPEGGHPDPVVLIVSPLSSVADRCGFRGGALLLSVSERPWWQGCGDHGGGVAGSRTSDCTGDVVELVRDLQGHQERRDGVGDGVLDRFTAGTLSVVGLGTARFRSQND